MDKHKQYLPKDKIFVYILFAVLLSFVVYNLQSVLNVIGYILSLGTPFYIAIIIGFIMNIPMKKIEELILKNSDRKELKFLKKNSRGFAIAGTIIIFIAIIIVFTSFITPRIAESIGLIINNMTNYISRLAGFMNKISTRFNLNFKVTYSDVQNFFNSININEFLVNILNLTSTTSKSLSGVISSISDTIVTSVSAFFMSLYLLSSKEKHTMQLRKIVLYIFKKDRAIHIFQIAAEAHHYFTKFVSGQLLEATIFMTIVYIAMRILSIPFSEIVGLIAFVFSFIPMFGSFFTLVIGSILVSAAAYDKLLLFVIVFVSLQQFEGNIVYPRVVGKSVGISGLFVLLGITVFGRLFGFFGVLIAVPLTAFIYAILDRIINISLYRQHIEVTETEILEVDDDGQTVEHLF